MGAFAGGRLDFADLPRARMTRSPFASVVLASMAFFTGCGGSAAARATTPSPSTGYGVAVTPAAPAPEDVSSHMAARAQEVAFDMVPSSYLEHGFLGEGQEESFNTIFEAGHCYRILGVAGASMADLDLVLHDENGNEIDRDSATDAVPVLGAGSNAICPRWTGPFYVTARAFRGSGDYGIQVFRTP
jgi:hypothetical protein